MSSSLLRSRRSFVLSCATVAALTVRAKRGSRATKVSRHTSPIIMLNGHWSVCVCGRINVHGVSRSSLIALELCSTFDMPQQHMGSVTRIAVILPVSWSFHLILHAWYVTRPWPVCSSSKNTFVSIYHLHLLLWTMDWASGANRERPRGASDEAPPTKGIRAAGAPSTPVVVASQEAVVQSPRPARAAKAKGKRKGPAVGDLRSAVATVNRLTLQNAAALRGVTGTTWTSFLFEEANRFAVAGAAAGQHYDSEVKKRGRGHGMGSPHSHVIAALLKEMAIPTVPTEEWSEPVKEAQRSFVAVWDKGLQNMTEPQTAELFPYCRLRTTYAREGTPAKAILCYALNPMVVIPGYTTENGGAALLTLSLAMRTIFGAEGEAKTGGPPRSHLERQCGDLIKKLQDQATGGE